MSSIANWIDHSILEEEADNRYYPTDDWKIDIANKQLFYVTLVDMYTFEVCVEGKHEEPYLFYVLGDEDINAVDLFHVVDYDF